jgi:hypothetical protein
MLAFTLCAPFTQCHSKMVRRYHLTCVEVAWQLRVSVSKTAAAPNSRSRLPGATLIRMLHCLLRSPAEPPDDCPGWLSNLIGSQLHDFGRTSVSHRRDGLEIPN